MSIEQKDAWLHALAWAGDGTPRAGLADALDQLAFLAWSPKAAPSIPAPNLSQADAHHVQTDPSSMDLPFAAWPQLCHNLSRFQCLSMRDTRQWRLYTTFQMELFAFKRKYEAKSKIIGTRDAKMSGASSCAFAGLDFHSVLERLCLLHYGKVLSLPYHVQMQEFQTEQRQVALHMLQCVGVAWAMRRRIAARPELIHPAWRGCSAAVYTTAVDGLRNSLISLRRLVTERSPFFHFGQKPHVKKSRQLKSSKSSNLQYRSTDGGSRSDGEEGTARLKKVKKKKKGGVSAGQVVQQPDGSGNAGFHGCGGQGGHQNGEPFFRGPGGRWYV